VRFLWFLFRELRHDLRRKRALWKLKQRAPTLRMPGQIHVVEPARLFLGRSVLLQPGVVLHCGGGKWSDYKGFIRIGDDSEISPHCVLYGAGEIEIGDRFDCGPGTMLFSSRSSDSMEDLGKVPHKHRFGKITIGNDVILFAGVIVGPGVTIGDGAVVGANSLVLKDIPSAEVWGGSPAGFLRKRTGS
jgi:acetyltransferase-like isoleucine patch superfamily enzyme